MSVAAQTLAKDVRRDVAALLQPVLADLIDLSLQGKQAHWNVVGVNFTPLHTQLDKVVEDAREWSDAVAERIRALDVAAEGQMGTVVKRTSLKPMPEGTLADRDVVKLIVERLTLAASRARKGVDELDKLDKITQDLLIGVVEGLEKHLWMFRVQQS